jgi:hypothetical protein
MSAIAGEHCRDWNELDFFYSLREYQRFQDWIQEEINAGRARAIRIPWGAGWGNAWDERWYQCTACRQRWRLVGPDPPFRGIFKKVKRKRLFAWAFE